MSWVQGGGTYNKRGVIDRIEMCTNVLVVPYGTRCERSAEAEHLQVPKNVVLRSQYCPKHVYTVIANEAQQNTAYPILARISVELLRPHSVGVNLEVALLLGTEPTVHKGVAMISRFEWYLSLALFCALQSMQIS